jgi:hypothetical protein
MKRSKIAPRRFERARPLPVDHHLDLQSASMGSRSHLEGTQTQIGKARRMEDASASMASTGWSLRPIWVAVPSCQA